MAIDIEALKNADKEISKGTGLFLYQKNLSEGTPIRLLPNSPQMGGLPYFRVIQCWINGKAFTSLATFGKPCIFEEEIAEAINSDDADTVALATDEEKLKISEVYWWPILQLEYTMTGNEITGTKIVDKAQKILSCTAQLTNAINEITMNGVCARIKSEDKITDRILGYNLMASRVKKDGKGGRNVKYGVILDEQMKMPEKYYVDVINPYEVAKSFVKLKAYQRAVIREYLYGEEIPKKVQELQDAEDEKRKDEFKAKQDAKEKGAKVAKPAAKKPAREDDEEEEEEKPKAKPKAKAKPADDEDEEEDAPFVEEDGEDDEDEAPKKPAKKSASKKVEDDVDMEDDDEEEEEKPAPKKSAPSKAAVATKAVAKKKIDDDIDFED